MFAELAPYVVERCNPVIKQHAARGRFARHVMLAIDIYAKGSKPGCTEAKQP